MSEIHSDVDVNQLQLWTAHAQLQNHEIRKKPLDYTHSRQRNQQIQIRSTNESQPLSKTFRNDNIVPCKQSNEAIVPPQLGPAWGKSQC